MTGKKGAPTTICLYINHKNCRKFKWAVCVVRRSVTSTHPNKVVHRLFYFCSSAGCYFFSLFCLTNFVAFVFLVFYGSAFVLTLQIVRCGALGVCVCATSPVFWVKIHFEALHATKIITRAITRSTSLPTLSLSIVYTIDRKSERERERFSRTHIYLRCTTAKDSSLQIIHRKYQQRTRAPA